MIRNIAVLLFAAASLAPLSSAQGLPDGPAKETFVRICGGCHEPENVMGNKRSREEWEMVVGNMFDLGAQGTDAEKARIIDYLSANFGLTSPKPKVNVNTSGAKDLADGLGLTAAEADAIVAYRAKNGKFSGVDDLKKVQGVDAARLEAAKDRIVF